MAYNFDDLLKDLVKDAGADGAVLVSPDGLAIASVLSENIEEDRVAAMGAAILSLGERVATELEKGELEQLYVKGSKGYVIFTGVKDFAVLGILAPPTIKLGLLLMEIKKAVKKLEEMIG